MEEQVQEITESSSFFIPGYKDSNTFSQDALRSVVGATKAANDLPSSDDYSYYSTFPGFRAVMSKKKQSILSLMTSLVQGMGIRDEFKTQALQQDNFDLLVDVNDVILENVSNYLDEASGLKKSEEELVLAVKPSTLINTSWNRKQYSSAGPQSYKLLTAKNVSRPQLQFKDKIDNSNSVFVPIIKEKPNSIKPLAIILEPGSEREEFCHPYEWEIEKFQPLEEHLGNPEPQAPKPLDLTPLVMVRTEQKLKELCSDLKEQTEFAVDLEHHSYRSFQGFTCLMQISTREKDYIIDVLELRSELHQLNDVFTDPKIVKVLHGADMDVFWLQRDFGIYIVNLFDTGQAARVLQFAHLSLSYLLKHYCKIDMDKRFQLADWRIRPLPEEMIKYAREDTHYLLYVYDCMKNDLLKSGNEMKNLLLSTFDRSKVICAKKYQKPLFSDDKYLELYKKSRKVLNPKQLYCLRELFSWRDSIARENDESIAYVLPNHMLMQIAGALPREQQGILACCNPIPPLVKQQLNELHSIILKANESSLKQLEILELQQKAQTPKTVQHHIDLSSLVHCPHDIHHLEDKKVESANQSSHAENLLPIISKSNLSTSLLKEKPTLSVLFKRSLQKANSVADNKVPEKVVDLIKKLISPFERYKMTEELQAKETVVQEQAAEIKQIPKEVEEEILPSTLDSSGRIIESSKMPSAKPLDDSTISSSCEIVVCTPLRKKKRKRKNNKPEPDITLLVQTDEDTPSNKKAKTPEVVVLDDDDFKPYDYSKSDFKQFSGKKEHSKGKSTEGKNSNKTPRKYFGKQKKHAKQATYSQENANKPNSSKWPKNR